MKSIFLSVIFILSGSIGAMGQRDGISNIQWMLTQAGGREVTSAMAYIEFDGGKFTGSTGCNRMFGSAGIRGDRIDIADIGSTKKMCKLPEGSVGEPVFLNALERASRFSISGNMLTIYDRRGRTILKFRRLVKQPPVEEPSARLTLESRKWVLESIKNRRTFAPIKGAFVNFDAAKRSAGGDTGCNVFGGSYSANGSRIRISQIVSTMRACIEDDRMTVEREFLDGLRNANRFDISNGRLMLYRGQNLLLTLRPEPKT